MCRNEAWIVGLLVVGLVLATPVAAQSTAPVDVVKDYFEKVEVAAGGGDLDALMALFAADATVEVPATQSKATGTAEITGLYQQLFTGYLKGLQGDLEDEPTAEGDTVVASYRLSSDVVTEPMAVKHTFVVSGGKIQSLVIDLPVTQPTSPAPTPTVLPPNGGTSLLPAALVLAGAALAVLGAASLWLKQHPASEP